MPSRKHYKTEYGAQRRKAALQAMNPQRVYRVVALNQDGAGLEWAVEIYRACNNTWERVA